MAWESVEQICEAFHLEASSTDLGSVRREVIERIKDVGLESPIAPELTTALRLVEEQMKVPSTELVPVREGALDAVSHSLPVPMPASPRLSEPTSVFLQTSVSNIRRRYRRATIPLGSVTSALAFVWALPTQSKGNPVLSGLNPFNTSTGQDPLVRVEKITIWILALLVLNATWISLLSRQRYEESIARASVDRDSADDALRAVRRDMHSEEQVFSRSIYRGALADEIAKIVGSPSFTLPFVVRATLLGFRQPFDQLRDWRRRRSWRDLLFPWHQMIYVYREVTRERLVAVQIREPAQAALERFSALGWIVPAGHRDIEPAYRFAPSLDDE